MLFYQDATSTDGAFLDMIKVIQNQHSIAAETNASCAGIVYVHKRDDCVMLASRISKVTNTV